MKIVTKKYVYKLNKDKLFRNFVVLSTLFSVGLLVYKIGNEGISWMSTIGYFG